MNIEDRKAIEALFGKLAAVEQQVPDRDPEAESFIRERMSAQPGAAYYMAQTVVVQEQALQNANARIAELERQLAAREEPRRGGLLGGLFGGGQRPASVSAARGPAGQGGQSVQGGPWGQGAGARPGQAMPPARGGGFLAGAAQTAVGVAGGVLLGNAIAGMFSGNEAEAAPPAEAEPETPDTGAEEQGFFDGGFDGGFDEEW